MTCCFARYHWGRPAFGACQHDYLIDDACLVCVQGVEEGLIPDRALYESLIKHHCRQDQLDEALGRLVEMQASACLHYFESELKLRALHFLVAQS